MRRCARPFLCAKRAGVRRTVSGVRRNSRALRLVAAILAFTLLVLVVSPAPIVAADKGQASSTEPDPNQQHLHSEFVLTNWDLALLAVIAFFFASLGLIKDFHHYRGLLHTLSWNFYSWLFLVFTGACIFAVDYMVLPVLHRVIQRELMLHLSLALGHTGVSAVLTYASPYMLALIPVRARALLDDASPSRANETENERARERERPTTELNVLFAEIRASLENEVNGKVLEWTHQYSWPVIKSTGKMLLSDLTNSGTITREESERLRWDVDGFTECEDVWDNRQRKYELLRRIMKRSSYRDLHLRLQRAKHAERFERNS